ncbi:MAG: ElyC/SanA/YdcF family protein [Patescibacteria group bacterium]
MDKALLEQVAGRLDEKVAVAQLLVVHMLASDPPSSEVDMLAIHGLSAGMYQSGNLLECAAELWRSGLASHMAVVGGDGSPTGQSAPGASWVGSSFLIEELAKREVPQDQIIVMDPITHTKEEAYAIVRAAMKHGYRSVMSVTVPYHGPRVLSCLVAVMKELGYWIEWHMMVPPKVNWTLEMVASQGKGTTNSLFAAMDDAAKVQKYVDNSFGASYPEVIYYLLNRARIVEHQQWDFPGA